MLLVRISRRSRLKLILNLKNSLQLQFKIILTIVKLTTQSLMQSKIPIKNQRNEASLLVKLVNIIPTKIPKYIIFEIYCKPLFSCDRKQLTHNFIDSKNKGVVDEMLSDLGDKQNVCLVNIKQPFNMYNTTHNFMTKSNNHSFNLSYNLGATGGQEKKPKKYSTSSNKHQKNGVYSSYSNNGSKKKQTRASSNTEASHMHITKQEDYMSRSSKKKKNILFK